MAKETKIETFYRFNWGSTIVNISKTNVFMLFKFCDDTQLCTNNLRILDRRHMKYFNMPATSKEVEKDQKFVLQMLN